MGSSDFNCKGLENPERSMLLIKLIRILGYLTLFIAASVGLHLR